MIPTALGKPDRWDKTFWVIFTLVEYVPACLFGYCLATHEWGGIMLAAGFQLRMWLDDGRLTTVYEWWLDRHDEKPLGQGPS